MALAVDVSHTFNSAIPDDPAAVAAGQVTPQAAWNGTGAHTVAVTGTASDAQLPDKITAGGPTGSATVVPVITYDAKGRLTAVATASITQPSGANPSASVGLSAVNGSASTFMRSDAAPPLDQTAAWAFSGLGATTISAAASGAVPLTISGYSLIGSQQQSMVSLAGTLNTSGSPDVVKWSITDTARGASTKLFNIYAGAAGATSVFSLDRSGGLATGSILPLANNTYTIGASGNDFSSIRSILFSLNNGDFWTTSAGNSLLSLGSSASRVVIGSANLTGPTTATLQLGAANAASPVAQTVQAQGSRAGTDSNVGGANLTVTAGNGTGTGTLSSLILQSPVAVASGTGAQTQTTGLTIKGGQAVLPTYTVATLPTGIAGGMAYVTDGDAALAWGATVVNTGAGATKYQCWFNNANWTVVGK